MKKFIFVFALTFVFASPSFSAVSNDLYVRQDIFDAKIDSINSKLDIIVEDMKMFREDMKTFREELKAQHKEITSLAQSVAVLSERVNGNFVTLSERIDGNFATLSRRMDGLERQADITNTFLYYLLVLFGAMLLLPFFSKWWDSRKTPSITADEVKRLIAAAISEAKLNSKQTA